MRTDAVVLVQVKTNRPPAPAERAALAAFACPASWGGTSDTTRMPARKSWPHYLDDYAVARGEHKQPGGIDNLARATYAVY